MSKIFVIPDVHLKPWMFEKASEILSEQDYLQVVGHTPVISAIQEGNLLSLDNFSTYRDGIPYGDQRFVFVDTTEKTWQFA